MVERASPIQQRRALDVANLLVKAGIGFVPVPVANAAEFDKLTAESMDKLAEFERAQEAAEQNGGAE
jgi:hypothetical protein